MASNTIVSKRNSWEMIKADYGDSIEPYYEIQNSDINPTTQTKRINELAQSKIGLKEKYFHLEGGKIQITGEKISPIKQDPFEASLNLETHHSEIKHIPYPGKSASFQFAKNNWKDSPKLIEFKSETKNSLITKIIIKKDNEGTVNIKVCFNPNNRQKILDYFKEEGIINIPTKEGPVSLENPMNFRKFYYIIKTHNDLPYGAEALWNSIIDIENYVKIVQQQQESDEKATNVEDSWTQVNQV